MISSQKQPSAPDLPPSYSQANLASDSKSVCHESNPPTYEQSKKDWEAKTAEERRQYEKFLRNLDHKQKQELIDKKKDLREKQSGLYPIDSPFYLDALDIWYLSRLANASSNIQMQLGEALVKTLAEAAPAAVNGIVKFGAGVGQGLSGGGGGGGGDCGAEAGLIVGAIAVVTSGLIAAAYAIKKCCSSIKDIVTGEKVGKGIFRLGATATAGYFGAVKGAVIGAAIGSGIPVIGTAAGAVIGAICGSGFAAAAAAVVSKYTAKCVSWLRHRNDKVVSKTNPDKYKLPENVEKNLSSSGVDTFAMLDALRNQKNNEAGFSGSIPGTRGYALKEDYNDLLKAIKKGADVTHPISTSNTSFKWNGSTSLWEPTALKTAEVSAEEPRPAPSLS